MRKVICFFVVAALSAGLLAQSVSAHSEWFRKGKYHISMVHNGETGQDVYTDPDISDLWIEIGQDSIEIVKTYRVFMTRFEEGESLELNMDYVSDSYYKIKYAVVRVDVRTNEDGGTNEYMVCRTAEGVECEMNIGTIGKSSFGNTIYGINFTDPDFQPILWCFKKEEVQYYER